MSASFNQKTDQISNDPMDRVPVSMKQIINTGNVMFDVHCHVFNYECVPDKFFGIRIPFTKKFLQAVVHFLHKVISSSDTDKFSKIGYFLDICKSLSIEEITIKLFSYYHNTNTIFCPLMMDFKPGIKGSQQVDYDAQLFRIKKLRDQYPERLLPFVAIEPNNPDAENIFLKAFSDEYKFFGIKIYPSLGYLPSHPVLMKIYEVCEAKKIPVTAHCGGGTVHNSRHCIKNIQGIRKDQNNNWAQFTESRWFITRNSYANYFNSPKKWEPVLHSFPNLKLNLAHFGSSEEWEKLRKGKNNTRVSRIMDLMARYENVYADFAKNISNHHIFQILRERIEDNVLIAERTLYGSDYYMIVVDGHFRSIKIDFITSMGDNIMKQIASENPKRFLFS